MPNNMLAKEHDTALRSHLARSGPWSGVQLRLLAVSVVLLLFSIACLCPVTPSSAAANPSPQVAQARISIVPNQVNGAGYAWSPDGQLAVNSHGEVFVASPLQFLRKLGPDCNSMYFTPSIFLPDSRRVVLGCNADATIRIFDAATGETIQTFHDEGESFSSLSVSSDGRLLASTPRTDEVHVWDVATGALRYKVKGRAYMYLEAVFSPDGKTLAACGITHTDGVAITLWNAGTGGFLGTLPGSREIQSCGNLNYSPDGTRLYATFADGLHAWSTSTRRAVSGFVHKTHGDVLAGAVSHDGSLIAIGTDDGRIDVVDPSAKLVRSYAFRGIVRELQFSPTDRTLLASFDGRAPILVDLRSDQNTILTDDRFDDFWSHADQRTETLHGRTGTFVLDLEHFVPLSFEHNSTQPEVTGRREISSDGRQYAQVNNDAKDYTVRMVDLGTGAILRELRGHKDYVTELVFTPDGSTLVTASFDRSVKFWELSSGRLLSSLGPFSHSVMGLGVSPAGQIAIASEYGSKKLSVIDLATRKVTSTLSISLSSTDITFSPDGLVFAATSAEGLDLVRVLDQKVIAHLDKSPNYVWALPEFSPDSRTLVVRIAEDFIVLDTRSGQIAGRLAAPPGVSHLYFQPGEQWFTAFVDGGRWLIDRRTGKKAVGLFLFGDGEWVRMTADGFFDCSPNGAHHLNLVHGLAIEKPENVYQALYRPDLVAAALAGDPDGKVAAAAAQLDLEKVIESGSAPLVAITSPVAGSSIDADSVEVSANVTDQGGGIGKLEWRVNGVTLGVETRGFDRTQPAAVSGGTSKPITVTQTLSLDPGENQIELVAYNARGLIASDPARLTLNWDGASSAAPPKLYVLAVGVNDYYDSRLTLTYAVPDAKAIGAAFESAGKGLYSDVDVTTVLDGDVTADKLGKVFADLGTRIKPRDVFVLFMSGHGKTQDGRYYFIPADFKYVDDSSVAKGGIDQDRFQSWLAEIPARKSVLLYDTCDSGSLTEAKLASRGLEEVAALSRMTRAMGRTVLSASTDDAPALEGYQGHGVFTYALLSALGTGDANADGVIDVTELASSIDKSVPDISYTAFKFRQIPQMSIVGSDFPLAGTTQVLTAADTTPQPAIPTTPTHVVIAAADVHETADPASPIVAAMQPGDQVSVVATDGDFVQIAQSGKQLGFVDSSRLLRLH